MGDVYRFLGKLTQVSVNGSTSCPIDVFKQDDYLLQAPNCITSPEDYYETENGLLESKNDTLTIVRFDMCRSQAQVNKQLTIIRQLNEFGSVMFLELNTS